MIELDSLVIVEEPDTTERDRAKVADLLPVAEKIKEAAKRVQFTLDEKGANKEIERLRLAARIQGYSLRTVGREPGAKPGTVLITVKAGKLIEREKGEAESTEAATEPTTEAVTEAAPKATPKAPKSATDAVKAS